MRVLAAEVYSTVIMSVFLCCARGQKRIFVDHLYEALREEGVDVFMDESLLHNFATTRAALQKALVGMVRSARVCELCDNQRSACRH